MVRLFVKEVAEQRGLSMSQLQLRAQLPMSLVSRYWHNKGQSGQLVSVQLRHIDRLCEALNCEPGDLLRRVSA